MMAQGVAINNDNSNPEGSAMLDVKSIDKGFLPPRMNGAQRDAIANPVAGLVVWCSNCGSNGELQVFNGTNWTNTLGGNTSVVLEVGAFYEGGVVFYLDGIGGGLVCAITDQSIAAAWGCEGITIIGADGYDIGTGAQNTIDIEAGCTTPGTAADVCANLTLNGYSDWFLPSDYELTEMYNNKSSINTTSVANGGWNFALSFYWSSTEFADWGAWVRSFDDGNQNVHSKHFTYRARAVRAF